MFSVTFVKALMFCWVKNLYNKSRNFQVSKAKFMLVYCFAVIAFYNFNFWSSFYTLVGFEIAALKLTSLIVLLGFFVYFVFLYCFSFSVGLLKGVMILLLILSSVLMYFLNTYNVYFDTSMVENVFATDINEASNLFNVKIVLYLLCFGFLPSVLIFMVKIKQKPWFVNLYQGFFVICAIFIFCIGSLFVFSKEAFTFFRINRIVFEKQIPYSFVKSGIQNVLITFEKEQKFEPLDFKITRKSTTKGKVVVLVIGETARAKNFSLYGYNKNTNPLLSKQNVFVFKNTVSCGTNTAVSVPCMFYPLGSEHYRDHSINTSNFVEQLDALNNLKSVWIDNNFGYCYGVCDNVESYDTQKDTSANFCKEGECVDEVTIDYLKDVLQKRKDGEDLFVIIHQNGSHGPLYYKRYPKNFEIFKPTCSTNQPQDCSTDDLINTYDNTIVYTDHNLNIIINLLKKLSNVQSMMLYVSDHGESLGEGGIYLHGAPYSIAPEDQKNVPLILWLSSNNNSYKKECIAKKQDLNHDQDFVIQTVLHFFDIKSEFYNDKKDLLAGCN